MLLQLELTNNKPFVVDENQCKFLANFFATELANIHLKLVRDLSFISQLAHYKDGMQISHVSYLKANRYQVHFVYTWHIFQGCIGLDETGEMKDKATFTVSELGEIKVDLSTFEAHSTADEL
ncbi:MAG: hypothetical protein PF440_03270 [Thiomicrorhabdus sp.]|jgi:hypothetical protein|nr:hypothetical protein [Thiomicrorhabdus sp.]